MKLTFGSLFAGIGGFDLGFERAGFECRWQVEIDNYATKILEKHWPKVHRQRDIRECNASNLERVDCIIGGFPCQDISCAGRGAGLDGERSGLFFEAIRLVRELQPRAIVLENVAALLTRGLDRVLGTLAEIGYDAEWHCVPAAAVGAPHIRDRVFVLGYANSSGGASRKSPWKASRHRLPASTASVDASSMADTRRKLRESRSVSESSCEASPHGDAEAKDDQRRGEDVADAESVYAQGFNNGSREIESWRSSWWELEPAVGRSLDGFSAWVDGHKYLTLESHKRIMAYVINHEGINHVDATKKRTEEVLRGLRNRFSTEGVQWKTRGLVGLSSQEVLFSYLCKHTTEATDEAWLQLSSAEASRKAVRSMRTRKESPGSSCRPGQNEQQQGEHPDSMQALSRLLAYDARKAWLEYCGKDASIVLSEWGPGWEADIDRVANGVPARVDRLRCLGNAIVPQVAEAVAKMALDRLG